MRRTLLPCLVVAVGWTAACGASRDEPEVDEPPYAAPPESCAAPSLAAPFAFAPCSTGSGVFGAWTLDEDGLPAYDYGVDETVDPRAAWTTSDGAERRDHWASFGNGRVTALATNDGTIELVTQDRGPSYLNKVVPGERAYGGGFGWIDDGTETWATAYAFRPRGARATRRFGMGYASSSLERRGVRVARRAYAPAGDAPLVIDEVTIANLDASPKDLRYYEYWDVRRRPVEIDWLVSGKPFPTGPGDAAARRDARNARFDERVAWDPGARVLGLRRTHAAGVSTEPPDAPSPIDDYPGDPFLAVLAGDVADVYTDDAAFFGGGDARVPEAVARRAPGELASGGGAPRSGAGQPRLFVARTDLRLAPGESRTLRYAYGYARMGEPWPSLAEYTDPARDAFAERRDDLRAHLPAFASARDPFLAREVAWHASQLEASVGVRDYWGRHVVPQGSAYLFLHGADGALRDTALFAVPLVYTHRALARDQLALAMGLAHADDAHFTYAFQGHGVLDDALGLHERPSDLDLFFLLAIVEYLGATGDVAFLDERVSYWPRAPENEASVLDHVRRAAAHLLDGVGFGEHGLVRIGTGDWSDGIVVGAKDRDLAIAKGESVPNSEMALAVLPAVAELLDAPGRDPALAARLRAALPALARAVDATWTGAFYGRAYFGDGVLRGADAIDLEAQVWPLVGPLGAAPDAGVPDRRADLARAVAAELDDPSPIGATLTKGGEVWPAIAQLLTWGYTRVDDERAWAHLARSSLASRARAFPDVWFDVWSGPDGVSSKDGSTWVSPVTPMTDFPTMNANVHAMFLLGALRVAGVEARANGLAVTPHAPDGRLALRTELVDVDLDGASLHVVWRPAPGVPRMFVLGAPRGRTLGEVRVDGEARPVAAASASAALAVTAATASGVRIDATFAP